jgi:hypothetical protein
MTVATEIQALKSKGEHDLSKSKRRTTRCHTGHSEALAISVEKVTVIETLPCNYFLPLFWQNLKFWPHLCGKESSKE